MLLFLLLYPAPKIEFCFTKINLTCSNFTHRIQYLFFIISESLLLLEILIVTTVKVDKFHILINRNKEKTLQWTFFFNWDSLHARL